MPQAERELLAALAGHDLSARLRDLYDAGWSLSSLAEAVVPRRPRTTVHSWIMSSRRSPRQRPSAPLKEAPSPPVPSPFAAASPAPGRPRRAFASPRRVRVGIDATRREKIAELAPLARRHRPRTSPRNPARLANESLTRITRDLYGSGASIPELAEAAGVTYRAMHRRVKRR